VNTAMREKVLVFGGDDCITNDRRDVLILGDLPVLFCQFDEPLAVGIVDRADGRKLKAGECFYVRQTTSVKVDVVKSDRYESGQNRGCANDNVKHPSLPTSFGA